jgi:tetratricopeptide (TPR) repeat protein
VGRFHFDLGQFDKALPHLEKALEISQDDYMALFFQARILAKRGDIDKAEKILRRVLRYVPSDPQVHRTLGRVVGRAGDTFSGYQHYAYAALYRNQKNIFEKYLERAGQAAETNSQRKELERLKEKYELRKKYWRSRP